MPVLQAPLMSFTAQGRVAHIVYSRLPSCNTCYVEGGPPSDVVATPAQENQREAFKKAWQLWKALPIPDKQLFHQAAARDRPLAHKLCNAAYFTAYTLFMSFAIGTPEMIPIILLYYAARFP